MDHPQHKVGPVAVEGDNAKEDPSAPMPSTDFDLLALSRVVGDLSAVVSQVAADVAALKTADVATLKTAVSQVAADVATLKTAVNGLLKHVHGASCQPIE